MQDADLSPVASVGKGIEMLQVVNPAAVYWFILSHMIAPE